VKTAILALLTFVTVATVGCQPLASRTTRQTAAPPAIGVEQLRAAGLADLEAGRYDNALRAFVEALSRAPEDARLHYLVGVTFAQLQRRDDAIIAFRWVVEHGRPGSKEVQGASQWLAENGMLSTTTVAAASSDEDEAAAAVGVMEGRTDWPGLDPERPLPALQLQLEGTGLTTQGKRYGIKATLNGPYKFPKVKPGDYRLRAQIGYTRLWDMPVTVGEKTILDLTQDNTVAPKDAIKTKPEAPGA
jgi:hypothetical protein